MDNLLSLQNVSWKRDGRDILSEINWEMKKGENWGILGLNGSGKTSLLNIITAYEFPSSGEISVLGYSFGESYLPDLRKEIGFVSSSLSRFSHIIEYETIEEIIVSGKFASFGLYEQVHQEDWEKADELIGRFRLESLKGKPYKQLSQGERRRVLIARSLMNDPKLLILDEPCSGLDILSREQVLELTKEIVNRPCQFVYVTHHIEELVEDVTHVLSIKDGKIVAAGPKHEVVRDDILTETFKLPVHVRWEDGRPWLSVEKKVHA
ncbi:ABC transporter ATP-binding protein [Siminovitchia sediminis]|uniref:ABC transporter ATP-binding protein n=1 Tax=Siminovitchia sediminis TaxID=1274353 RepID=A0ABW4KBI5_9BACI